MSKYLKTVFAIAAGAIGWATAIVNSAPDAITATEWIAGATFLAVAVGVYGVPNTDPVPPPHP